MNRRRVSTRGVASPLRVLAGRISLPAFVVTTLAATGWPVGCGSSSTPAPSAGQLCQSCKPLQMAGISGPGCDDGNGACRSFTTPTSHELCCLNADCSDCADAGTPACTRCTGTVFDCTTMTDCCECAAHMPDGSLGANADGRSPDATADSPEELAESADALADAGMRCPTAQDCMALAQNECARIDACEPWVFNREYIDQSDCTKQLAADCAVLECAPGADPSKIAFGNAAAFAACVSALPTASCFDFLNNNVAACDLRGNKANGSSCSLNSQCASGDCVIASPCGACSAKAGAGGACSNDNDCNQPMICFPAGAGTCQPAGKVGDPCNAAAMPCGLPNSCVNGSCAAPAKIGMSCGGSNGGCDALSDGALCSTNDAGAATCAAVSTSAAGGSCSNGEVCTGGSVCNGATCIRLNVGDTCGTAATPCPLTLVCSSTSDAGTATDAASSGDAAAETCQPLVLCP